MVRHFYSFFLFCCVLLSALFFFASPSSHAAEGDKIWTTSITIEESNQQAIEIASDGAGGAIIVWEDNRNSTFDIFAKGIDHLGSTVWGHGVFVTSRSVDRCVNTLRGKIEPDPARPRFIQTVRPVGYRFET